MQGEKRFRRYIPILVVIIIIVIAIALYFILQREKIQASIYGSGIIEATEVDVSAQLPAKIIQLYVDEGYAVKRGDPLVSLDDSEYQKACEQAEAALKTAQSQLEDLIRGPREQEIKRAQADVEAAAATMKQAQSDLDRYRNLYKEEIVPIETLQQAETAFDVTSGNFKAAQESLKLLEEGSRKDQIEAARWQMEQAKKALEEAKIRLSYTMIRSTLDGRVLSKNFEEGELAVVGSPIFTIADVKHPWVKIYVGEKSYGKVKLGMHAFVESDSFPGKKFEGRVSFINSEAEFTPKNIQTKEERVKLVFAVKVEIQNEKEELKPGMPVDVEIPLNEKNG